MSPWSSWNYRVMRHVEASGDTWYAVHEVYYDDRGEIAGWTERPVWPCGDEVIEVSGDLADMLRATERPILDFEEGHEPCSPVLCSSEP